MWLSLKNRTDGSLLEGLTKIDRLVAAAKEKGDSSCVLMDRGNLFNSVHFFKACKKAKIKSIIGCEIKLKTGYIAVIAKNLVGWKSLIKLVSFANTKEKLDGLDLEDLRGMTQGLLAYSGGFGSQIGNSIFKKQKEIYTSNYDNTKKLVIKEWEDSIIKLSSQYQEIFGADNFFFECQLFDQDNLPVQKLLTKAIRFVGEKLSIPRIATADSHYIKFEDACDQWVLISNNENIKTPLTDIGKINRETAPVEVIRLLHFLHSARYFFYSSQQILDLGHVADELSNTVKIADMCESYDILSAPQLPDFKCPDELSQDEYLKKLCQEGWKKKIKDRIPKEKQKIYVDRIKTELGVLQKAGLSSYFLIVRDIVMWVKENGGLNGASRGSAGGSLCSYLLQITSIDPIEHHLIFERFYNEGRNSPGNIEMPDIDIDIPVMMRDQVLQYIEDKYGIEYTGMVPTFGRLMGKQCLKDVLRSHGACSFDEMNKVTEFIEDEAKIADKLQEMVEEGELRSIILWSLQNNTEQLREYCYIDENGKYQGQYAKFFEKAIRIEGVLRSQSKHAAAICISRDRISDICPMLYDKKNGKKICGVDMNSLKALGVIKWDILGVAALDKIMRGSNLLSGGENASH